MSIDFDALMNAAYGDDADGADAVSASPKEVNDPQTGLQRELDLQLIGAAGLLAGPSSGWTEGLALFKAAVEQGATTAFKDASGLRAIDILARGGDSMEAAAAVECLAEAGHAQVMMTAPGASDMPPMMAAAFSGNACVVERFLELGMPGDVRANAPREKIVGGTPFHATVIGYRQTRKDDFAAVLRALLTYCPDGINVADTLRQKPIDLATKAALTTGDKTLLNALMQFGVQLNGAGDAGADKLMQAIMDRDETEDLRSLMAVSEARMALREIDMLRKGPGPAL